MKTSALRRRFMLSIAVPMLALPIARAQDMPVFTGLSPASADPNAKLPEYDVASVKQNKSGDRMMRISNAPDGFSCVNIPLKTLVALAYGIRQDLISGGPGWVSSTGFDIQAKVAGSDVEALKKLSQRQRPSVLQPLLAERFNLKVHSETKMLPMYNLIVAKGGPKLKADGPVDSAAGGAKDPNAAKPRDYMSVGPGNLQGRDLPISTLANNLSYVVHSTVVDQTGLAGGYDFDLKWTPDDAKPASGDASAESGPSIFTAVQEQLGLKLQPAKGPVETLVIDHAEMPSAN